MSRIPRCTLIGFPHLVSQKGNYGQTVFEEPKDFQRYLDLLLICRERYSIETWAYCLMPNHVHFICIPKVDGALSRFFNSLHMRYAQYFLAKKSLAGHLWMGRFHSCILDERSVFEEVRYIENNPVRAGIVERAEMYPWSSARHHVLGENDPLVSDARFLKEENCDWISYLSSPSDELVLKRTWKSLKTGRPAGDTGWVHELEAIIGRRLLALQRGRPRKTNKIAGSAQIS